MMKSDKKWIILLLTFLLVFSLTSCKRQGLYDMENSPWEENNPKQYVWGSKKQEICIVGSDLGLIGMMNIDGQEKLICLGAGPGLYIDEYDRSNGNNGKTLIHIWKPKYKEGEFTIRVPLEFGQLYAGKKITFTRYEKDAVQPSDFGFDYESWDDLVSQFELVDADTGETVSLDVLK